MPRRDPINELRKALDKSKSGIVCVMAADVVSLCESVPPDPGKATDMMHRGCAGVPPETMVSVGASQLRGVLDRLPVEAAPAAEAPEPPAEPEAPPHE